MFYVLMGILATAVAVLMFNHEAGEVFGFPIEVVASVTLASSWLLYLVAGRFGSAGSILQSLKQAAIWLLIGFGLVLGYSFKDEVKMLVHRVAGELIPGAGVTSQSGEVTFRRADNGHFMVRGVVNGESVPMIVDSGARMIVLTHSDAKKAGLDVDSLSFSSPVSTANGRAFAARIWLERVSVGGIEEKRVPAMVAQDGALRESLLGMSYLDRLGGWSVSGDRLTMTP